MCTVLAFSACNKDDDGPAKDPVEETITPPEEETVTPPTVLTGVFKDSEVQGLSFTTTTQTGITNEKGEFSYVEGETITFKVGELTLGSATAEAVMTPISLVKTVDAAASIESPTVQNMAALLQTLDQDSDHSNGISISQEVVAAMGIQTIDFSLPVESTLADIVLSVAQNEGTALQIIYPGEATENMANALNMEYNAPDNYTLSHLMPTLKAFLQSADRGHTPASAVYKNTFDVEGKLVSTSIISRFSGKVFYDFNFTGYAVDGQPTNGNYTIYNASGLNGGSLGFPTRELDLELTYDANHHLATFTELSNGQALDTNQFTVFDEENRPLAYFRDLAENDPNVTFTISLSFTYENGLIKTSSRDYYREETGEDNYYLDDSQRDFTYTYNEYDNITVIDYPRTFEFTSVLNGEENNSIFESVTKETFTYDTTQKLTSITASEQGTNTDGSPFSQDRVKAFDENELLDSQIFTSPDSETTIDYEAGLRVSDFRIFNGQISSENEYNADGSSIQTSYYYDEGELYLTETYERDADFRITKRTETYYLEGEINFIDESLYDSNGNIITIISKDANGQLLFTYNYTYNSAGEIATVEGLNADGSVLFIEEWEYENGLLSRITVYNPNGTLFAVYYYDEGQIVLGEFYDENGNLVETVDYRESAKASSIVSKRLKASKAQENLMYNDSRFHRETQGAMMSKKALGTKRSIQNQNELILQHLQISRQARNN